MADLHEYLVFRLYAPLAAWGDIAPSIVDARVDLETPATAARS